jgi:hypothetical protein
MMDSTRETLSTAQLAGRTDEQERVDDRRVDDERVDDERIDRAEAINRPDDDVREPATGTAATADLRDDTPELLPSDENAEFQRRWETIQTGFVDEPRQTVEQADELVAHVMKRLAEGFASERERLEQQWGRGEDVSTEDLRIALQRYRGFFQRLLAA